jgi:hypothetical protein
VSPTVFRYKGYRFFFFSREEERMHVHVYCADGEAKVWIEPRVELCRQHGLTDAQVGELLAVTEEHRDEIIAAWSEHFGR